MNGQATLTKDERTLAGLAHGSILLGLVSGGIGGIVAAHDFRYAIIGNWLKSQ